MKECFKCGVQKPLDEFYLHKQMADGHLNKCKECTKVDVAARYADPNAREKIIAYERHRATTAHRRGYRIEQQRKYRRKHRLKYLTRQKTSRAVKSGKLLRNPCEFCGDAKTQAHHTDYSKPLQVQWLCRKHHMQIEGKNSWT